MDRGFRVVFVHDSTPNPPASPNPPRKSSDHRTGGRIDVREGLTGLTPPLASGPDGVIRAARPEAVQAVSRSRHAALNRRSHRPKGSLGLQGRQNGGGMRAVHDKRRHLQCGEQVTHVGAAHGLDQRRHHSRAGRSPLEDPRSIAADRADQAGTNQLITRGATCQDARPRPLAEKRASTPDRSRGPARPDRGCSSGTVFRPAAVTSCVSVEPERAERSHCPSQRRNR